MPFIYHEDDGDLNALSGRQVSLIGYGNLGRPFALNLRDSGLNVLVGTRGEEHASRRATNNRRSSFLIH